MLQGMTAECVRGGADRRFADRGQPHFCAERGRRGASGVGGACDHRGGRSSPVTECRPPNSAKPGF
ncbi:MAG: hypothetical protein WCF85_01420 [Rhodospirillaceae bacterium]